MEDNERLCDLIRRFAYSKGLGTKVRRSNTDIAKKVPGVIRCTTLDDCIPKEDANPGNNPAC